MTISWLKLFSLALAVLVWLTVTFASQKQVGTDSSASSHDLPVTVLASAEDVRNFKVSPNEVQVTVQGDAKTAAEPPEQGHPGDGGSDRSGGPRATCASASRCRVPAGVTCMRVAPEEVQVIFPPDR